MNDLERAVDVALAEDLGGTIDVANDVTTVTTTAENVWCSAILSAKQDGTICGIDALRVACERLDERVEVVALVGDGDVVAPGDELATAEGPARAILVAERSALNLIGHLSGIATVVRRFVEEAPGVKLVDTRKTTPGLRALEKYAVVTGGGANHRFGLHDGVLVKENHIMAAGGIAEATRRAKAGASIPVQVECTTITEIDEALDAGADSLLLDNMTPGELRTAAAHVRARNADISIEASGGVHVKNVGEVAASGVDRISIGAFTHSAPALDVSLKLAKVWER